MEWFFVVFGKVAIYIYMDDRYAFRKIKTTQFFKSQFGNFTSVQIFSNLPNLVSFVDLNKPDPSFLFQSKPKLELT